MTTNLDYLAGSCGIETPVPFIKDPEVKTLLESGKLTSWWTGSEGLIEGVRSPSTTPVAWKDSLGLKRLKPRTGLKSPLVGYDSLVKQSYLQFGYGGTLTRDSNTLKHLGVVAGGSGYVAGDTVTLSNGVVVTYRGSSGAFANAVGSFEITNYGSFSSHPTAVMTQVSTSGSGSGATFLPSFFTDCGSLEGAFPGIPGSGAFFIGIIFRCPLVSAQPKSGGWMLGGQLNHCDDVLSTAGNNRQWGLEIDASGRLRGRFLGDQVRIDGPATDFRDDTWHLGFFTGTPGSSSRSLWGDGSSIGTLGAAFTALSSVTGAQAVRVGACGLPDIGPTGGFCGRIGAIVTGNVNLTTDTTFRQSLGNKLLSYFRPGLTHD